MRNIYFIILLFISSFLYSQENGNRQFGEKNQEQEYFFAFKLMPSTTGEIIQCAIVRKIEGKRDEVRFLSKQTWAREFTGYQISKANPYKENFALKYNIFEIPAEITKLGEGEIKDYSIARTINILSNLWRLRYSEYPYLSAEKSREKGWAAHPDKTIKWLPSDGQMEVLQSYGINQMSDFCAGDNAYKLLKDIRSKEWQANYTKNGEPASTEVPKNSENKPKN